MSEKGSGLPENYTRFYQGELRMRLAAPALVRPITVAKVTFPEYPWRSQLPQKRTFPPCKLYSHYRPTPVLPSY